MPFAIRVNDISKRYRIQHTASNAETDGTPKSVRSRRRSPWQWLRGERETFEDFWALRDVSFEVGEGEAIGIIGPNGAGKSTLLKILSRVTKPTSGEARIRGRVGSLLDVGTGFHPELTGRENVYLCGSVLGMRRTEIARKFDEIVSFSGVEQFLDTPVKRYSRGMYVRLAFSVAAHLEPDILIVDEVLAVGDAEFHEKCLKKMAEVEKLGYTVLLVSHSTMAIQKMCKTAIWLEKGRIVESGNAPDIVLKYLTAGTATAKSLHTEVEWPNPKDAPGNEVARIASARVRPRDGAIGDVITMQNPTVVEVDFWNLQPETNLSVTLHFYTREGIIAFGSAMVEALGEGKPLDEGRYRSICHIPPHLLNDGILRVTALIVRNGVTAVYEHENLLSFRVFDDGEYRDKWYGRRAGIVRPILDWSMERVENYQSGDTDS